MAIPVRQATVQPMTSSHRWCRSRPIRPHAGHFSFVRRSLASPPPPFPTSATQRPSILTVSSHGIPGARSSNTKMAMGKIYRCRIVATATVGAAHSSDGYGRPDAARGSAHRSAPQCHSTRANPVPTAAIVRSPTGCYLVTVCWTCPESNSGRVNET